MTCKHKDCIYRQGVAGSSEENCGYMLITGNKRNSPADNCDKYRSRKSRVKGWQRTNEAGKKRKAAQLLEQSNGASKNTLTA